MNSSKKIILAAFLLTLIFTNPVIAKSGNEPVTKAVIKTAIYCDHCKVCESCGGRFKIELSKIKGLKKYILDDKNMTITVFYNNQKTNINAIRTAISEMGFDADNIKASPKAYEKLDACCKR